MEIINLSKSRDPKRVPGLVYCGRAFRGFDESPVANPCSKPGTVCPVCDLVHDTKAAPGSSLPCYKRWLGAEMREKPALVAWLKAVPEDARLGCWCQDPNKCHASVVAKAIQYAKESL